MKDDLLSQALAALQGNEARPYTIKVGGVELSADGAEDHARLLEALGGFNSGSQHQRL